ncbi:MAG TPA: cache domain-containing protein [Usitatibacter sp.]|nr:cache domain-containing protein [Usitatibacter sp.]
MAENPQATSGDGTEKTLFDPPTLARPGEARRAPNDPRRVLEARPPAPSLALPPGFRLFEYKIGGILGQGGFGIAYAATDVNLAARVVIKEYLPEEFAYRTIDNTVQARDDIDQEFYQNGLDSFLVEARTLATFRHRNIVRVARFFEANNTAYMVLEYERGQSLKSFRRKHETLPEATLASLLAPLLDGLAVVHATGYLHRDIKPDNIYVRDEDGSLVLLDFGAARQTAVEKSEIGVVVTPGYGPLEQYAGGGRQGPWTDLYSLGATLFWLITGQKPLDAPARMSEPHAMPSAESLGKGRYSPEFLRAIDWCLELHPEDRPQSVAQLRPRLFASHAGALGLQEALAKTDEEHGFAGADESRHARRATRFVGGRLRTFARAFRRPGSWPIAVKMALAMVATALAPMIITAYFNLSSTQAYLAAVEQRNLEQLAQTTAGRISQMVGSMRGLADYVGTDDDFVAYLRHPTPEGTRATLAKLDSLVGASNDIQFVMVMDRDGNALVASDPEVMGKNFRFREYFKQAMQGNAYMTGIIVGTVAGASGVFFSRPVLAPDGRTPMGAVVMRVKAEPIGRMLAAARAGDNRLPFLVDGDGVIVWHPDDRLLFKSLAPLKKEALDEIVADQRFRRRDISSIDQPELAAVMIQAKDRGSVSYRSTVTGREEITGYAPVPGNDWVVGVSESRDYFAAPLDRLFWKVVVSVLLAGGIFVALAIIFARSIVKPIEKLTAAAHALKSGDYENANVEVRSADEIGQLARTFNVMIDVLRQRERERSGHGASIGFDRPPEDDAKTD